MWERHHLTAGTESGDHPGTTLRCSCEKYRHELLVQYDATSNQLQVQMRNGEYEYQSEWLDVSPLLEPVGMDQLLQEGLRHWHLHVTSHSIEQWNGLTPVELITLLYRRIDHVLA
jgi:hypothetical protein